MRISLTNICKTYLTDDIKSELFFLAEFLRKCLSCFNVEKVHLGVVVHAIHVPDSDPNILA